MEWDPVSKFEVGNGGVYVPSRDQAENGGDQRTRCQYDERIADLCQMLCTVLIEGARKGAQRIRITAGDDQDSHRTVFGEPFQVSLLLFPSVAGLKGHLLSRVRAPKRYP